MSNYSAQQSSISENNRSRILQYLYHNGICSRAQIAKAVGLTPAAITKITAKLLAQNIIEETGDMEGDKNRRSIGLNLNCGKYHVIGLKFARSLVQIGLFDLKCNRISLTDLPTVSEENINETVKQIHNTIRHLIAKDEKIVAVGMARCTRRRLGTVPVQSGTVRRIPRLLSARRRHRSWHHRQWHDLLRCPRHRHRNRTHLR